MLGWMVAAAVAAAPAPDTIIKASDLFTVIPKEVHLAEAIAWDGRRLFTGSVVDGGLWMRRGDAWSRVAAALPPGGLLTLAWDRKRKWLWAGIGAGEPTANAALAFHGVVALEPRRFRIVRQVALPSTASPGDMAVLSDSAILVSDGLGGVYRWRDGETAFQRLPEAGGGSPQGMVETAPGRVHIADYDRGLLILDSATGAVRPAANPTKAELRGIDGLAGWKGGLVGVQNGTRTRRILSITLDKEGGVASVVPIEQGHPDWGEPTLITAIGRSLAYIADAQWSEWQAGGTRKARNPPRPTPVRVLHPLAPSRPPA